MHITRVPYILGAENVYEWVFAEVMYSSHNDYIAKNKGLFPNEQDWYMKKLEEYFGEDLTL